MVIIFRLFLPALPSPNFFAMTAPNILTLNRCCLRLAAVLALAPSALPTTLLAQQSPPALIDYQGRLTDVNGAPLGGTLGANFTVEFRIYNDENGNTTIWGEKQTLTVKNGEFSVRLGEGIAIAGVPNISLLNAFDGSVRFLGVTVSGQGGEILPRLAFLSSPFAIVAQKALVASSLNQTAGTTTTSALTVTGQTRINGSNVMEFGAGVAGKNADAGKIGYGTFNLGSLNIVGAGNSGTDRRVYIYSEGGTTIAGPLSVTGLITGNGGGLTNLNAGSLATGTIPAERLSGDLAKLNTAQTFNADQTMAGNLSFGSTTRQMLNLWSQEYGMGVQPSTLYSRAGVNFAWYLGGSHSNSALDAGGGKTVMTATPSQVTVGNLLGENFGLYVKGTEGVKIESVYAGSWKIFHSGNSATGSTELRFQYSGDSNYWFYNGLGQSGRTSDISLKKDVEPLEPSLDRVMGLRPVSFRFKNSGADSPKVTGFIAQEVEPLFPDLVSDHDGTKGVAETDMISITVAALQEEHQQRTATDARQGEDVQALKAENAALLRRLEILEKKVSAQTSPAVEIK